MATVVSDGGLDGIGSISVEELMHVEGGIVVHSLSPSASSLAFATVWLCCQCQERR
jgi:hypothetical protein